MNHVFEECPVFNAQQIYPKLMNVAFSRPHNNLYAQMYNSGRRNHLNFLWSQNNNDHSRSNHFQHPNHDKNSSNHQPNFPNYHPDSSNHQSNSFNFQQNFPNHAPQSSFQSPPLEKRMTDFEKTIERYMRNQESHIQTIQNNNTQAITRLEVQMSQLAYSQIETSNGILPSQPLANPRNSNQVYLAKDQ